MNNNTEMERILDRIDLNLPVPLREPKRQYYFIKKARNLVKEMEKEQGRPLTACVTTF